MKYSSRPLPTRIIVVAVNYYSCMRYKRLLRSEGFRGVTVACSTSGEPIFLRTLALNSRDEVHVLHGYSKGSNFRQVDVLLAELKDKAPTVRFTYNPSPTTLSP